MPAHTGALSSIVEVPAYPVELAQMSCKSPFQPKLFYGSIKTYGALQEAQAIARQEASTKASGECGRNATCWPRSALPGFWQGNQGQSRDGQSGVPSLPGKARVAFSFAAETCQLDVCVS